jgi:hypothetical protein
MLETAWPLLICRSSASRVALPVRMTLLTAGGNPVGCGTSRDIPVVALAQDTPTDQVLAVMPEPGAWCRVPAKVAGAVRWDDMAMDVIPS